MVLMKTRLLHLWDNLNSSYWFLPGSMVVLSGILAFASLWIDRHWTAPKSSDWIYTGGAAGARALLSTVAGSVITVAGVVFSITIATLTQASSQFGPRLLRNFMRDVGNQFVLGTFVATFFYCLLVLRAVRGMDDAPFVPNLSITIAVVMAAGSLAVLIYFIDHICHSLQGPQVVAAVGIELVRAVSRPFPSGVGKTFENGSEIGTDLDGSDSEKGCNVAATDNGYLQAMDEDGLLEIAKCNDWVIRLACRPGDYIMKGSSLLRVESAGECGEAMQCSMVNMFFLGRQRTAEQDMEYSIRQLVEIGVRALSPGINDPFTAMNCVDWLGTAIAEVARHGLPSARRYDDEGRLRVVAKVSTFSGLVDAAFNQIRQFGADSVAVSLHLLEVLASVAKQLSTDDQRKAVLHHVEMVYRQSCERIQEQSDLAEIKVRYRLAMAAAHAESISTDSAA
jgi:uncharacterized membrane protein